MPECSQPPPFDIAILLMLHGLGQSVIHPKLFSEYSDEESMAPETLSR